MHLRGFLSTEEAITDLNRGALSPLIPYLAKKDSELKSQIGELALKLCMWLP